MNKAEQFKGSIDPRDWPEDWDHDNGMYMCKCHHCSNVFIGHKRRMTCKLCNASQKERWDNLTPEQRDIESKEAYRLIEEFFQEIKKTWPTKNITG